MNISERQLREMIQRQLIKNKRLIIEAVTADSASIPTHQHVKEVEGALETGAGQVKNMFSADNAMSILKNVAEEAGFSDPCEYAKQRNADIRRELSNAERAADVLRSTEDPIENLGRFQKIIGGTMAVGIVPGVFSAMKLGAWTTMVAPAVSGLNTTASISGAVGLDSLAAWFAGKSASTTAMAVSKSAVLGMTAPTWIIIGKVLLALGIAIALYKFLLKTGAVCKIKELAMQLGNAMANIANQAYDNVFAPFIDKISNWGSALIDKISSFFRGDETTSTQIEAVYAIEQWNKLNEAAISFHFTLAEGY